MTHEEALLIDIKFQLDMYASGKDSAEDTLARVREIISSPSLTDDQQVVLEWFKNEKKTQPFATVADFVSAYFEGAESEVPLNTMVAFEYLTNEQQFQVLAAFAEWGLSNA